MHHSTAIRKLVQADLDFADELRRNAGWNQRRGDWLRLLEYEPEGCFLAEYEGRPAGTVTTTTYGVDLAWIGMMLVSPEFRRRGIATALMERSLEYLRARGVRCIKLDATPAGQPVYERLGFRAEWEFHRWEFEFDGPTPPPPSLLRDNQTKHEEGDTGGGTFEKRVDAQAFGADRTEWLARLRRGSFVVEEGKGWGMSRAGELATYLGPVVAEEAASARRIVTRLLDGARQPGGRVYWDVPGPNVSGVELARSLGFFQSRPLLRMWTGEGLVRGRPELQFGIGDPGTG